MAFVAFTTAEVSSGRAITEEQETKKKDNFDAIYSASVGAPALQNPSFEIDSDSDNVPDSWTLTTYSGGTATLETSTTMEGTKTLKFVHPGGAGNGGGYADSDYIAVSGSTSATLSATYYSSVAGPKVQIVARFFDKDKVTISLDDTCYSTTTNPTVKTLLMVNFNIPNTAKFMKIRLIGGYTDTAVASTIYFDALSLTLNNSLLSHTNSPELSTSSGSYVKCKETTLNYNSGYLTISFQIKGGTGYGKIYKNGVAIGTERTTTDAVNYTTFSETILSNFVSGDLIQIYGHVTPADTAYIKNLVISSNNYTVTSTNNPTGTSNPSY